VSNGDDGYSIKSLRDLGTIPREYRVHFEGALSSSEGIDAVSISKQSTRLYRDLSIGLEFPFISIRDVEVPVIEEIYVGITDAAKAEWREHQTMSSQNAEVNAQSTGATSQNEQQ
jgi:hypothetical protein